MSPEAPWAEDCIQELTLSEIMSEAATAILNSAERRMRIAGFDGFSFREVAADVGVKSSSVHYHFPTKERLAAAVIHRRTRLMAELIDRELEAESDPVTVWTRAFGRTVETEDGICPCTLLGAGSADLPPEVAAEVKNFFRMCLDKLVAAGLSQDDASELLATITGAMVVSMALKDTTAYGRATGRLAATRHRRKTIGRRLPSARPAARDGAGAVRFDGAVAAAAHRP